MGDPLQLMSPGARLSPATSPQPRLDACPHSVTESSAGTFHRMMVRESSGPRPSEMTRPPLISSHVSPPRIPPGDIGCYVPRYARHHEAACPPARHRNDRAIKALLPGFLTSPRKHAAVLRTHCAMLTGRRKLDMASPTTTLRLRPQLRDQIARLAKRHRRSFSEVAQDLIDEALRLRSCPGIYFADEPTGRVPRSPAPASASGRSFATIWRRSGTRGHFANCFRSFPRRRSGEPSLLFQVPGRGRRGHRRESQPHLGCGPGAAWRAREARMRSTAYATSARD